MGQKESTGEYGDLRTANYLVGSYLDLKDVIDTIEEMIKTNAGSRHRGDVRKMCRVSVVPLTATPGSHILRVRIPEDILGDKGKTTEKDRHD